MTKYKPRYTVRKQSSGYTYSVKWYVWDTITKGRVSVCAYLDKRAAQSNADDLNVIDMTVPADIDDRTYEIRHREAVEKYAALIRC